MPWEEEIRKAVFLAVPAVLAGVIIYLLRKPPETPPPPTVFTLDFEDKPVIRKMTFEEFIMLTGGALIGVYWWDSPVWLETATIDPKGEYRAFTDPYPYYAQVEEDGFESVRAAKVGSPPLPSGYAWICRYLVKYLRNPWYVRDGVYRMEACFKVPPSGGDYIVTLGLEDHLRWDATRWNYACLDTSNGWLGYWDFKAKPTQPVPVKPTNFTRGKWFKLKLEYDTQQNGVYPISYECEGFKTEILAPIHEGVHVGYLGYAAFNCYAGVTSRGRDWSWLQVDKWTFKAKVQ